MSGKVTHVQLVVRLDDGGQVRRGMDVPFGTNMRDQDEFREYLRTIGESALDDLVDYGYLPK